MLTTLVPFALLQDFTGVQLKQQKNTMFLIPDTFQMKIKCESALTFKTPPPVRYAMAL